MTPEEIEDFKEERRAYQRGLYARKKAKERREKELREMGYYTFRTAWQWLRYHKREVMKNATPQKYSNDYYYYRKTDTFEIDDKRAEELKEQYIEKYKGWEEIDLEHTTYNGQKWY